MEQLKLTEEQQELVVKNKNLAYHIKNKFVNTTQLDDEEIESACFLGLCKAAKTFKVEKGVKFGTYASRCMQNEVLMELRKRKNIMVLSLDGTVLGMDESGKEHVLSDIVGNQDKYSFYDIDLLKRLITHLSPLEQYVLHSLYVENLRQRDIAETLGYSQSYVSRLSKGALYKMRRIHDEQQLQLL